MIKASVHRRRVDSGALERLEQALTGPTSVKVGLPREDTNEEIVERAVHAEFGSARQVERPFLRNTMAENRGRYRTELRRAATALVQGETTLSKAMDAIGATVATDMRQAMSETAPLSTATIERKGSDEQLVETGELRDAITHRVEE